MVLSSGGYLFTFILIKMGNFASEELKWFKTRSKTDFHVKGSNVNERSLRSGKAKLGENSCLLKEPKAGAAPSGLL